MRHHTANCHTQHNSLRSLIISSNTLWAWPEIGLSLNYIGDLHFWPNQHVHDLSHALKHHPANLQLMWVTLDAISISSSNFCACLGREQSAWTAATGTRAPTALLPPPLILIFPWISTTTWTLADTLPWLLAPSTAAVHCRPTNSARPRLPRLNS